MYETIRQNLLQWVNLSEPELDFFCGQLKSKQLKRKEFLLQEGEICSFVAFVNQGCLRYFYNADGEERTGQFFFENAWYTDYASFLSSEPSQQNIQALEPTQLLLLNKSALYQLYRQNPKIERFGRLMAENAYLGSRKNNVSYLTLSPEERYLKLIEERPKLISRISLKYIASYLGVKPESLSRIRKRLFDNK